MRVNILARCPRCATVIVLGIQEADRRKRCVRCGRLFHVPDTAALGRAVEVIREAKANVFVDEQGRIYG